MRAPRLSRRPLWVRSVVASLVQAGLAEAPLASARRGAQRQAKLSSEQRPGALWRARALWRKGVK
eukprot:7873836-Pyramimonas_sp.AAC.1